MSIKETGLKKLLKMMDNERCGCFVNTLVIFPQALIAFSGRDLGTV